MIEIKADIEWPYFINPKGIITTSDGEVYKVRSKFGHGLSFELSGENLNLIAKNASETFSTKKLLSNDYIVYQDNQEIMRFHNNRFLHCDTFSFNNNCYRVPDVFNPCVDDLSIFFNRLPLLISGTIKAKCPPEYKKETIILVSYIWVRQHKHG